MVTVKLKLKGTKKIKSYQNIVYLLNIQMADLCTFLINFPSSPILSILGGSHLRGGGSHLQGGGSHLQGGGGSHLWGGPYPCDLSHHACIVTSLLSRMQMSSPPVSCSLYTLQPHGILGNV